jgi:hypothetical protein
MTCNEIHSLLPTHVYGDLPADEAGIVDRHLRECAACRAEVAALNCVRSALDASPIPKIRVDVPALFATAAERRVRRWRRLAVAGLAVAAALLLVFALRLQVTASEGQITIAWGNHPASGVALAPRRNEVVENHGTLTRSRAPDIENRLQLLQDLTRALATDIESRDRQRGVEIDAVRARLDAVQQFAARQWANAERTMNALYVAQFKRSEEKANP